MLRRFLALGSAALVASGAASASRNSSGGRLHDVRANRIINVGR